MKATGVAESQMKFRTGGTAIFFFEASCHRVCAEHANTGKQHRITSNRTGSRALWLATRPGCWKRRTVNKRLDFEKILFSQN
jgi:hypothetical protein